MTAKGLTMRTFVLAAATAIALATAACGTSNKATPKTGTTATGATAAATSSDAPADFLHDGFAPFETPVKGGRLKTVANVESDTWNGLSYFAGQWSLFYLMARGLYGYPNTVEEPEASTVRAELAEDLPTISDDGLTYTVKLRSGLRFSNGQPVTAADVKATFEYMLDPNIKPGTGGPAGSGYYNVIVGVDAFATAMHDSHGASASTISGIVAVDELTTEFHLTQADGSFLRALAMAWAFIRPASTRHTILLLATAVRRALQALVPPRGQDGHDRSRAELGR